MSTSISIEAFHSKESEEFKKHLKVVKVCIETNVSFPKETFDFFKGKVHGEYSLDELQPHAVIEGIENGIQADLKIHEGKDYRRIIKVSEIPKGVDEIHIRWS